MLEKNLTSPDLSGQYSSAEDPKGSGVGVGGGHKAKNEKIKEEKMIYERLGEVYEIWEPHLLGERI